jgi:hypothetical protein
MLVFLLNQDLILELNGAIWEAEAFHRLFYKKPLITEQFERYPLPF